MEHLYLCEVKRVADSLLWSTIKAQLMIDKITNFKIINGLLFTELLGTKGSVIPSLDAAVV